MLVQSSADHGQQCSTDHGPQTLLRQLLHHALLCVAEGSGKRTEGT